MAKSAGQDTGTQPAFESGPDEHGAGTTRRQLIAGAATVAGIVTVSLPSVAAAVSDPGVATSTTVVVADPSATSAVPSTSTNGVVDVTGSDTF